MNIKYVIKLVFFLLLINSCKSVSCDDLPTTYNNYGDALKDIRSASFKISETISTEKSSWIKKASYYSCDGEVGYFIIEIGNREYLHSNVPIDIWEDFKDADSFGSYYNYNIRGRYYFKLGK